MYCLLNLTEKLRTMSLTLAKAEKKDINRINDLFIEMLQNIYNTNQVNGYSDGALNRFFDGRDEWICIAVDGENIVAFLSIEVHHEDKDYIYLDDLSVTKQYRNNGIGTKLIGKAESYANEINVPTICFHVEKSNIAALRLYERLGYVIYEDQGNRYLMIKNVHTKPNSSDR